MNFLAAFLVALISMLIITPVLRKLAIQLNYVEKPVYESLRKLHKKDKPYLAGVGMFAVFWMILFFTKPLSDYTLRLVFIASFIIFLTGMVDDWIKIKGSDLKAGPKLIIQLIACFIIFMSGIAFKGFTDPISGDYILLPYILQAILTVLWIFGVMTVVNFSDGMDGLAGGISCISCSTLFVVSASNGLSGPALMAISLVGITLGYLRYNHFPSKILMGDAGATFLGFIIGIISLEGPFKQATAVSILIPLLALGIPIFDNLYVMYKRHRERRPLHIGDASQIHFRLHNKGLSQKQTVYVLYLGTLCLNLIAIILMLVEARS